mgnify:FL=1
MRSQLFEQPQLFVIRAGELLLSGRLLLELMREVLARGLPFRFCARGWSMAPFIRNGDVITVAPLQGTLPGIGRVVAFVRPGTQTLVVHRVVGRRRAAILIQGDNITTQPDGLISALNLLGQVTHIERNGKAVWLGLGPERVLIACFSRARALVLHYLGLASNRKRVSQRQDTR